MSNENPDILAPISTPIPRDKGCWNCIHWDNQEKSRNLWSARRIEDLKYAKAMFDMSKSEDGLVFELRSMVNRMDHLVAAGSVGICAAGKAESDFCHHAYLCASWSGRLGSSLTGGGNDKLPGELKEDQATKLNKLVEDSK